VTYSAHFISGAPDYTVNATWLQRLSDVVDMATAQGLYVITNVNHGTTSVHGVVTQQTNVSRLDYMVGHNPEECKSTVN